MHALYSLWDAVNKKKIDWKYNTKLLDINVLMILSRTGFAVFLKGGVLVDVDFILVQGNPNCI